MQIDKHNLLKQQGCFFGELDLKQKEELKEIFDTYKNEEFRFVNHVGYLQNNTNNFSFEELEKIKINCINDGKAQQFWYFNPTIKWHAKDLIFFKNTINNILKEVYPENVINEFENIKHISFTLFNNGCFINNHSDANDKKMLCNFLIYLSEDYVDGMGGELIVENNYKITPQFGKYAIIDFYYSNPNHRVEKILGDYNRYAFITSFCNLR